MWSQTCIGLHVKCRLFLSDFNGTWIFSTDSQKKNTKISKCHVSSSSGNRAIPCGRTDDQTDRHDAANIRLFAMLAVSLRVLLLQSFPLQATKEQEGMEVHLHLYLTLVLDGCYWSASHPGGFTCGQHPPPLPNTHLTGGRVAAGGVWIVLEKRNISYLSRGSNRYFLVVRPLT